ncbi:hypothetical protein CVS40_0115 [Lucilia cuprina]|nr:hypothetical protein CVS40_0115 [Lucilia cuprina]
MDVPLSVEGLLRAKTKIVVRSVPPGSFHYLGIENELKKGEDILQNYATVELDVNVDGIPLFKSSRTQLWPILIKVVNVKEKIMPMPVGIFVGPGKPHCVENFFKDFVEEVNVLNGSLNISGTIERQNNSIIEILAEHKVLLSKIISQNNVLDDIMGIFPIKLRDLNSLIQSQADPYLRRMKSILKGNVGRYLNEILGQNIIMDFNVDGTHGKQSLKKFENFYSALIDVIAVFSDDPDTTLRKAFQSQKKRLFKANRLEKLKKEQTVEAVNEPSTSI